MSKPNPAPIYVRTQGEQSETRLDPALTARANHVQPTPALFEISSLLLRISEIATVALTAAILAAFILNNPSPDIARAYFNAIFIGSLFYAALADVTGVYDVDVRFSMRQAWGRVLTAWAATAMFMLTVGFLFKISDTYSRAWGILWFFGGGLALCVIRAGGTIWLRRLKRRGVFNQRVAIFGAGPQGQRLAHYIVGNQKLTIDLLGFFDDRADERLEASEDEVALNGNLEGLLQAIRLGLVDQVIVALPWSAESRLQEVVGRLAITPIRIRLAPDLASFAFAQRPLVMLGDLPVMTLFERPISGLDQIIKKVEDFVLGVSFTALLAPVLLLVAIAIKLDSRGPIFFRQPREGFNNRKFHIWKFRSMYEEMSEVDAIKQAQPGDRRVTRVGRFLRRSSLDELPQLFNVISGEMSLVGPRPHAASTRAGDRLFGEVVATYAARHKVKPGMTGWAQVSGWRGETDTEEKLVRRLEHDLYYIENWSVMFDLYIIVRTLPSLFSSRAY
ncbi:MAG: undecaprenyl-phosphate glucose phosphotransferase [Pseudomonadota bacterium]